ncbi:hypothetical protein [Sphingomonas humi]|uniref:Lipoprotein n=1 Tax=Sphingomonas humi TaxID=335630 RepID=A0ABP7S3F7_9SPHN
MRKFSLITVALALSATACASPKERIADSLVGYGIDQMRADCVGQQLQNSLSVSQLMELGRVARAARERDPEPSRLTLSDLLRAATEVRDPRVAIEVAKAAGRCNLTPMGFAPAKLEMDAA